MARKGKEMKPKCLLIYVLTCVFLLFIYSFAFGKEKTILIRYTHIHPTTYSYHMGAEKFAKLVEGRSNGRVKIELYPASQLYKASETIKAVTSGAVEMGHCVVDEWGLIIPLADIFTQPFLVNTAEVRKELIEGKIGQMLEKEMVKVGAKPMFWMPYDYMSVFINNKRSLRVPDDFKGLLIRTTPGAMGIVEALGGKAVRMNVGELYMALQRGTIDGVLTGPSAVKNRKLYEVSKYSTLLDMVTYYNVAVMNTSFWNKLPEDIQKILKEAAKEAERYTEEVALKEQNEGIEIIKEKTQVYFPTVEELKLWEASTRPVVEAYEKKGDPLVKAAIEEINRIKGGTKK